MSIARRLPFLFLGLLALAPARAGAAQIEAVPFTAVHVGDAFWGPRFETNRRVTIPYDFQKCEETGRIRNFAVAGGLEAGQFEGIPFNDSDVYKVIEGAAYSLATHPDPKLEKYLDELIDKIAAAQEPDGYLYTARTIIKDGKKMPGMSGPERWMNERSSHELYNVGHLYEAAVAYYQATGKRKLLDVSIKNADLIDRVFGPGKLQLPPGHEEIEIGLVKLYRVTKDEKYLRLAKFFVDARGQAEGHKLYGDYAQDHKPVAEQTEAVGHAVRAAYLYSGVADVAALTGDQADLAAIDKIWEDVVGGKLYLTGGIGARHGGEAFGDKYELPNKSAYNETCAAIANALWNQRMFLLHGDAKYIDVLERVIYNGFLSGISLEGKTFFYPNPLEADGRYKFNQGSAERSPWFGCSCCPVNVVRFIPSIAGYVYATRDDALYVNLFIGGTGEATVGGRKVKLTQATQYPWAGKVVLTVEPERVGQEFELRVRIPGWAQGRPVPSDLYRYAEEKAAPVTLKVAGETVEPKLEQGYAVIRRAWQAGDKVEVDFPMPVRCVLANEGVKADAGRVAVERGPIVFCAEGVDNGGRALNLVLPGEVKIAEEFKPDLLGGVMTLRAEGMAASRDEQGKLVTRLAELRLIPYYAWNHRGVGEMEVWLPRFVENVPMAPPATLAGRAKASVSYSWKMDTAEALHDGIEPQGSGDESIPRMTWWAHLGTREWAQYDFATPTQVEEAAVYWFDDTGSGKCRSPQSWRLLYKDGAAWKPVEAAGEYGLKFNQYNEVKFKPVTTSALRLEVQLKKGFSGGILEWRVK